MNHKRTFPPHWHHRSRIANSNPESLGKIVEAVAKFYNLPVKAMMAPGRGTGEVCFPRQVAMHFCQDYAHPDFVGKFFGKTRGTSQHARETVINLCETDNQIKADVTECAGRVKAALGINQ